jgi:hypothetical protein
MVHASDTAISALRDGQSVERRIYDHVDGCVACRRALAATGRVLAPRRAPKRTLPVRAFVAGAVAVFIALFAIAPVRSAAFGFVEIFEPHSVAIVPMTTADFAQMKSVPDFTELGDTREVRAGQQRTANNAFLAGSFAGYHVREPQFPSGETASEFQVSSPGIEELTFSQSKAQQWAVAHSVALRPMPAGMDGSAVRIAFGSIVTAQYNDNGNAAASSNGYAVRAAAPYQVRGYRTGGRMSPVAYRTGSQHSWMRHGGLSDSIFVAQMPVPKVGSSGVSLQMIEAYLLAQPGMPQKLVSAIAALRDPTTTLPIPVPIDHAYSQPVFVDGVWGMGMGDDTGLGAFVVWERDGFIYGVGGSRKAGDVLAIANSLR